MRYLVTKEIESETQVLWFVYFQDFVFLIGWIVMTGMLQDKVHSTLSIPYWIFSIIMGICLVLPSAGNPKRRKYQAVTLYLTAPKDIFRFEEKFEEERTRHGKGQDKDQRHLRRTSRRKVR